MLVHIPAVSNQMGIQTQDQDPNCWQGSILVCLGQTRTGACSLPEMKQKCWKHGVCLTGQFLTKCIGVQGALEILCLLCTRITNTSKHTWTFYTSSGQAWAQGPQTCEAKALPTEPSRQPHKCSHFSTGTCSWLRFLPVILETALIIYLMCL